MEVVPYFRTVMVEFVTGRPAFYEMRSLVPKQKKFLSASQDCFSSFASCCGGSQHIREVRGGRNATVGHQNLSEHFKGSGNNSNLKSPRRPRTIKRLLTNSNNIIASERLLGS